MAFTLQNESQLKASAAAQIKNARFVGMKTLNDTAFEIRGAQQAGMQSVFDNPSPYLVKSVFVRRATPEDLTATVYLRYPGGKSVEPEKILQAEVFGGERRAKRAERAFQRVGLLPSGFGMVPTRHVQRDVYGDVPGSFLVRLISYFQAFGEQGYRANMTAKRRDKLANAGRTERGFKTFQGAVYFVSSGRDHTRHLHPGVWVKSGIHGSTLLPLFFFVPLPSYRQRYRFFDIAEIGASRFWGNFHRNFASSARPSSRG